MYICSLVAVTPRRKLFSFWIDPEQAEGLKAIRDRDGVLPSEQIRRAIDDWLERKGVTAKRAERKRAATRKRS